MFLQNENNVELDNDSKHLDSIYVSQRLFYRSQARKHFSLKEWKGIGHKYSRELQKYLNSAVYYAESANLPIHEPLILDTLSKAAASANSGGVSLTIITVRFYICAVHLH